MTGIKKVLNLLKKTLDYMERTLDQKMAGGFCIITHRTEITDCFFEVTLV